jgi:AcrR family transcriptional regulator
MSNETCTPSVVLDARRRRGPNKERSAATRSLLVGVAGELFAAEGFANTSLARVADGAGVTKGALYHHFGDKLDLLEAVVVESQIRLSDHVERVADDSLTAREWLVVGVRAYLNGCLDPRVPTQLLFVEAPAALGWERWRRIGESFFHDLLLDAVTEMMGDAPTMESDALCDILYAYLSDVAVRTATADDPAALVDQALRAVTALLAAVTIDR